MQIPSATFAKFCYLRYVSAVPSTCSILGQWVPNRECLCGYGEKMGWVIEFPDRKFMNDEYTFWNLLFNQAPSSRKHFWPNFNDWQSDFHNECLIWDYLKNIQYSLFWDQWGLKRLIFRNLGLLPSLHPFLLTVIIPHFIALKAWMGFRQC